ncbi:MAG: hypothetical protein ACYS29_11405 [Planctomycetota bacterium]|jgi:3-oxoacyl-[acyl-carrier-protein] synthase III
MNKLNKELPPTCRAVVTGHGSFAPAKKLTNEDLARMVDIWREW